MVEVMAEHGEAKRTPVNPSGYVTPRPNLKVLVVRREIRIIPKILKIAVTCPKIGQFQNIVFVAAALAFKMRQFGIRTTNAVISRIE